MPVSIGSSQLSAIGNRQLDTHTKYTFKSSQMKTKVLLFDLCFGRVRSDCVLLPIGVRRIHLT